MCKWGTNTILDVPDPIRGGVKPITVDSCIAPLIEVLNAHGFPTAACCCGHGRQPGRISLRDGRELVLVPDYATANALSDLWPPINPETPWHSPPAHGEIIRWQNDFTAVPLETWLLGWLRYLDGEEGWSPVFMAADGGWRWSRDVEPLPAGVEVVAWAEGPKGPALGPFRISREE